MKKILLLATVLTCMATVFAQTTLTLTFKGRDQHNAHVQLNNVTIQNVTRGWTEAIFFPDTVYTLTVGTGVADYLLHGGMQVMPNPFDGMTQVNIRSSKSEKATITVVDINGRRCAEYSGFLSDGDNYFEIQLTTPQTYVLSVQTADGTRSLKMVNTGRSGSNQIKEAGENRNAIQLKSTTSHIFELGDEMCYTGYSQQSNGLIPSTPITQNQYMNEVITLFFVLGDDAELPIVATVAASNIGMNTATTGGNVLTDGGADVIARGVCYSVTPNPTLSENHTTDGTGTGAFTSNLSNLVENTTYYVRAYATNSVGTAYGNEVSFTTEAGSPAGQPCPGIPTVTDYDGNVYNTVQIGAQCWMKENLRTTHYANGDPVPAGNTESETFPYRYMPNNSVSNVTSYGYLYNWPAVMHGYSNSTTNPSGVQGVCPTGWHVPSDAEWNQLINYVNSQNEFLCGGYNNYIAKALASNVGWNYHSNSNPCAVCNDLTQNNATGFSAMPAGYCYGDYYENFGDMVIFSSSSFVDYGYDYYNGVKYYGFSYDDAEMYPDDDNIADVELGFSVRCVHGQGNTTQTPKVITTDVTYGSDGTATGGGYVINSGASAVTARGICYGTSPNPTLLGSHTNDGTGFGAFTSLLSNLQDNTTYYVRAYATNSAGTSYGEVMSFTHNPALNDGVTVTFNGTTWQASYINGIWYGEYGIWDVYASQTQGQFPAADIATSIMSGTSTATADNQNGGLDGYFNWVEYYNETSLTDGTNYYGDWWAKNVTCTVSSFDATSLTLTANVNATMFSAYDAFINQTGVDAASTAPMTVDIVNVTLGTAATTATVTTDLVSNVTTTTAECSGTVSSDGGAAITERGFCWSTSSYPTVYGNHIAADIATTGSFTVNLSGLSPNTTYYVCAYATNSMGTAYGSQMTFTTLIDSTLPYHNFIGTTYYDLQSNGSVSSKVVAHSDGTVSAVWTTNGSTASSRGTGYNYFNGTSWINSPSSTARIENVRTGWGTMTCVGDAEIMAAHNGSSALVIGVCPQKGTNNWIFTTLQGPAVSNGSSTSTCLLWPALASSGNIIHLIACTESDAGYLYQGIQTCLLYYRGTFNPLNNTISWEAPRIVGNVTPAEVKQFSGDAYAIAAKGNTVAIVSAPTFDDVFLWKSSDNGVNFTKTTIFQHPYPGFEESTTLVLDTPYVSDGACAVALSDNGTAHVAFGITRLLNNDITDGVYSYYPGVVGMLYWNENKQPILNTNANTLDPTNIEAAGYTVFKRSDLNNDGGAFWASDGVSLPSYGVGAVSTPQIVVDSNNVYVVYTAILDWPFFDIYRSAYYRGVFARKSTDGGANFGDVSWLSYNRDCYYVESWDWTQSTDYSVSDIHDYYIYNEGESVFPAVAPEIVNGRLILTWQQDYYSGSEIKENSTSMCQNESYIYFMSIDANDIGVYNNTNEISQGLWNDDNSYRVYSDIQVLPDSESESVNFTISSEMPSNASIRVVNPMGQTINTENVNINRGHNRVNIPVNQPIQGVNRITDKSGVSIQKILVR